MTSARIGVYIISARRPGNVEPMRAHLDGLHARWLVADRDDRAAYEAAGAEEVYDAGGLIEARNLALEMAAADDTWCAQVSDDLTGLRWCTGKTAADTSPLRLDDALFKMQAEAITRRVRLAGVAPTANPFYSGPVKENGFCVGDLILVDPASEPRFDPALRLKEDYDFTLQHLDRYGAVARLDPILATFRHRDNPGGAVDYRTPEAEQEAIATLMDKWPARIALNPRRENEVLMRWPKARRSR